MLQEHTRQVIAAYVLNCPVNESLQRQINAAQQADISKLESALESCIDSVFPQLREHQKAMVEERSYLVFALMPAGAAIQLINDELRQKGILLDEDSMKQSLALTIDNSSGFILKTIT